MSEDRITDLEGKVAHLEYDEIAPLKKEVNDIKINLAENNLLTKQTIETNKEFASTLGVVKETLTEMAQSLQNNNRISGELTETVKTLNSKVDTVEDKMSQKFEEIDERAKIDWQQWIKNNWFGAMMGLGALCYAISQFVK